MWSDFLKIKRQSALIINSLVPASLFLISCSTGSNSAPMCSSTKSLLRFDASRPPLTSDNFRLFSNGGFIEVVTRKDIFGPIDSFRTCTAYVEFSDSPVEGASGYSQDSLTMSVYTASHCVDLSRDYAIKIHMFDTSKNAYYPIQMEYPLLNEVNKLRKSMKAKGLSQETQTKILNAFRTNVADLAGLFNQPTMSSGSTGTGTSTVAGEICLKKNDSVYQNVCSTYHDLISFKVEPSASTPTAVLDVLKEIRKSSTDRLSNWISTSKLAAKFTSQPDTKLYFSDQPDSPMDLAGVHKAVRTRVRNYSMFKMLQWLPDDLKNDLAGCETSAASQVCKIANELAGIVQVGLVGTGYATFPVSQLPQVVDYLKTEYIGALKKMDTIFTVIESLAVTVGGVTSIPFDTRVHSNFRLVTINDPTEDTPDPRDASRAFMVLNMNNLTGDNTGARGHFIKWNPTTQLGRFLHLEIARTITDLNRQQSAAKTPPSIPHVGFLQKGDSGSIVVVEHLPYFAVTSVDGESTSGGATIRPLPEPIEEEKMAGPAKLNCK
ncbi:MAG: hypothetical protein ACO3A4_05940 [Silvanigrellaceae bacterium]